MVRYTLEQRVFLYGTCVEYGSARKCRRKFRRKLIDDRLPSRQTIHNLVNKLRTAGLLIDEKQKHKRRVLTEQKLDDVEARLATFVRTSNPTKWQCLQT
jgi:transposase